MQRFSKIYPNGVTALREVDLTINQGEFVYIVGPSGAGKSTFMKMMYREEQPTSGSFLFKGIEVGKLKNRQIPALCRQIGVIFQDFKLLPSLTVYENVAFALEVVGEDKAQIRKKVLEVLDLVKLKHKERNYPDELSGAFKHANNNGSRSREPSSTVRHSSSPMSRLETWTRIQPGRSWKYSK
jgi:cell division transport system ATP-binding protein